MEAQEKQEKLEREARVNQILEQAAKDKAAAALLQAENSEKTQTEKPEKETKSDEKSQKSEESTEKIAEKSAEQTEKEVKATEKSAETARLLFPFRLEPQSRLLKCSLMTRLRYQTTS